MTSAPPLMEIGQLIDGRYRTPKVARPGAPTEFLSMDYLGTMMDADTPVDVALSSLKDGQVVSRRATPLGAHWLPLTLATAGFCMCAAVLMVSVVREPPAHAALVEPCTHSQPPPPHELEGAPVVTSEEAPASFACEPTPLPLQVLEPVAEIGPSTATDNPSAAPKTPAKPKTAALEIGVALGRAPADIYVDNKKQGRTPLVVKVSAGSHAVKWEWNDGDTTTQRVTVAKNETRLLTGMN